ncbi:hypothetical protein [Arthrobacter castelli]|uniref:hypothetical protein n=1 Tax=Arthrobacter castelli TaxID=271431 RepID=UPI0003F6E575|nr:hypothetical protein [Arthrobacter castelli]
MSTHNRFSDEQVSGLAAVTNERRFNALKDRLTAATGSPGLVSFHDGKVHMTLGEWERLINTIRDAQEQPRQPGMESINQALIHAADEVIGLADGDERITDAANLMVNAGMHFIGHPEDTLEDAIEANYDDETDNVLGWIR